MISRNFSYSSIFFGSLLMTTALLTLPAFAGVSPEEAQQLQTTLTPFGAERAGNADGTIPAWEGGLTQPPAGYAGPGNRRPDPYKDDKVLFTITAQNMEQYGDKLSDGQKAIFKKYPDTYKLHVYPTRRSHASQEWIYENTMKNATEASLTEDGFGVTGAYGGIAFPIPKRGEEVLWNHLTRYQGTTKEGIWDLLIVDKKGTVTLGNKVHSHEKWPYYVQGGKDSWSGEYYLINAQYTAPARRKGEYVLVRDPMNQSTSPRKAWQYLPGQRRVRRAPTISYDTPQPGSQGLMSYDNVWMFNGALDRYDWKIVGKKEMYIPYNNYRQDDLVPYEEVYHGGHMNPDYMRWELHRVWVVEATLRDGKRHLYTKRTFIVDEDSWVLVLSDNYDSRGELYRTNYCLLRNEYELPGVVEGVGVYTDLYSDQYAAQLVFNKSKQTYIYNEPMKDGYFTPENVRRLGTR